MKNRYSSFFKKLTNKYRVVIMREDNYEEKTSFALTRFNVLMIFSIGFILMLTLVFLLVSKTFLREYIPGYYTVQANERVNRLLLRTDSLEHEITLRDKYLNNLSLVLSGKIGEGDEDTVYQQPSTVNVTSGSIDNSHSLQDSLLRLEFENPDAGALLYGTGSTKRSNSIVFISPVKGIIVERFDRANGHLAVDVVTNPNEGIKAVMEGTVIFSEWSTATGHVIMVQHINNLVSIYKHNSALLKKVGNFVRAGEVIAIVGESGELTTGPHLHFELWENGRAVDPEDYITF